jgi:hypothetical protein
MELLTPRNLIVTFSLISRNANGGENNVVSLYTLKCSEVLGTLDPNAINPLASLSLSCPIIGSRIDGGYRI